MQLIINTFSQLIIPLFIVVILTGAVIKRINAYDAFVEGAGDGLKTVAGVFPYLAAMLVAISVFRYSGAMDALIGLITPILQWLGISPALVPMAIIRPLSGAGSLAMLSDIMTSEGVDSYAARTAAVMMGSTETIFYTLAVYCGAAKIKSSSYALPVALISGLAGMIAAIILCNYL